MWWGLGPLAALVLIVVAITVPLMMQDLACGGWAWFLVSAFPLLLPGAVLSLVALAGVWETGAAKSHTRRRTGSMANEKSSGDMQCPTTR